MRMFLLFILTLLGFINSAVFAIEEPTIVIRKEREEIYKITPSTGYEKIIFESDEYLDDMAYLPDYKLISFIIKDTIVFIDLKGQILYRISSNDAIKKYSWSPDGRIAYLTFAQKDPDYQYKYPTGLWIFDTKTKEREKIAEKVMDITWASFDTCIYLSYGRRIHKWDPKTETIDTTNLEGYKRISFSPDGEYYSSSYGTAEPYGYRLFLTSENKDITTQFLKTIGYKKKYFGEYPYPRWLKGTGHLLLHTERTYDVEWHNSPIGIKNGIRIGIRKGILSVKNLLYDPEKDTIVKKFSGDPEKLKSNNYKLIYLIRNESIIFEEIPKKYLK